jgi:hypothetical protein
MTVCEICEQLFDGIRDKCPECEQFLLGELPGDDISEEDDVPPCGHREPDDKCEICDFHYEDDGYW